MKQHQTSIPEKKSIIVNTFPRSGTHLMIDLLRLNLANARSCKRLFEPLDYLYLPIDAFIEANDNESQRILDRLIKLINRHKIPIIKSHCSSPGFPEIQSKSPLLHEWLVNNACIIHVYRNPKDVLSSFHFFSQSYLDWTSTNLEDWLTRQAEAWTEHTTSWLQDPKTLSVSYEQIMENPVETINQIKNHTNIKISKENIEMPPRIKSIWQGRLLRLSPSPKATEIMPAKRGRRIEYDNISILSQQIFESRLRNTYIELGFGDR